MSADRAHLLSLVAPLKIPPTRQQTDFMLQSGINKLEFHKTDLNTTISLSLPQRQERRNSFPEKLACGNPPQSESHVPSLRQKQFENW